MACNCGKNRLGGVKKWTHKAPDGTTKTYSSETEARMAAARQGGTVKPA